MVKYESVDNSEEMVKYGSEFSQISLLPKDLRKSEWEEEKEILPEDLRKSEWEEEKEILPKDLRKSEWEEEKENLQVGLLVCPRDKSHLK